MAITARSFLLSLLLTTAGAGAAAPVLQPHSQAELVAERTALVPGQATAVALRLTLEPHWHVYWKNPGDAGMPTSVAWRLPDGFTAGPLQWPAPTRIPVPPLVSYGYEDEVWLITDIQAPTQLRPGTQVRIAGKADWLVCKEICLPASADLDLSLPVAADAAPDPRYADAFARTRETLPRSADGWRLSAFARDQHYVLRVGPPPGLGQPIRGLTFFPEREGMVDNARPQTYAMRGGTAELRLPLPGQAIGETTALTGVLVAQLPSGTPRAIDVDVKLGPAPAEAAGSAAGAPLGWVLALGLAFVGGLILNLMPCVFPVLAIKVLGVVQQAHGDARRLRTHGLLFAAGVVLSFWAIAGALLALRAQGAALGWGYQLQSPLVVTGLALLFFVLALNLSGAFQMGQALQTAAGALKARGTHADALLSGLLATLVATPCTAPFMGAALGYALVQPALHAMLVFTALALGMALPYVVLCFVPALVRRLPRPGPWMETLKQLLAFPLYATVVWLVWVLGQQTGVDGAARLLAGLLVIAAGLWALDRWARSRRPAARIASRAAAFGLAVAGLALALPDQGPQASVTRAGSAGWSAWSEDAVRANLARGTPVFVDFTAAWCVTCQVNKKLVLQSDEVEGRFQALGVERLRADWTNRDPAITAALDGLQRSGVPVYALYLPGRDAPILLPEVLTRRIVLDALDAARPTASVTLKPKEPT